MFGWKSLWWIWCSSVLRLFSGKLCPICLQNENEYLCGICDLWWDFVYYRDTFEVNFAWNLPARIILCWSERIKLSNDRIIMLWKLENISLIHRTRVGIFWCILSRDRYSILVLFYIIVWFHPWCESRLLFVISSERQDINCSAVKFSMATWLEHNESISSSLAINFRILIFCDSHWNFGHTTELYSAIKDFIIIFFKVPQFEDDENFFYYQD